LLEQGGVASIPLTPFYREPVKHRLLRLCFAKQDATLQQAISLEMVVIHMFYGGMPRAKAEKSLRLFARKVLPAVQAMPTPINPASLGQPRDQAGVPT